MAAESGPDAYPNVEVKGGKGVVVGDFATVYQLFLQAPVALAKQIRAQEFKTLIDERTRNFVGRDFVFRAIDEAFRDADFPSGYILIRGEPGIGKTAFIAQLVKSRGYIHHFNVAPLGIRTADAFLSNVCAQLIVRYGLEHEGLPSDATRDGGFLSRLLEEAAATSGKQPIVIAVDALDEAEDVGFASDANRLFLPPSLPPRVFFIVSARNEDDYRLFVSARRDVYLRDNDPRNLDDVGTYIRAYLAREQSRMETRLHEWSVNEGGFVEELTKKSEGNFMYLVHVLRDIASGDLNPTNAQNIASLPQGLMDYYRRHWNQMRSVDEERFLRYQQPVVSLLATAREPVSRTQLLQWTRQVWQRQGWNLRSLNVTAVKDVLTAWREFLNEETIGGEARYRVYHASFQRFLSDEVGLLEYHVAISDAAMSKIPGFSVDG
jgi:hypothetical protein